MRFGESGATGGERMKGRMPLPRMQLFELEDLTWVPARDP